MYYPKQTLSEMKFNILQKGEPGAGRRIDGRVILVHGSVSSRRPVKPSSDGHPRAGEDLSDSAAIDLQFRGHTYMNVPRLIIYKAPSTIGGTPTIAM